MIFETIITSMLDEALKEYESNCTCDKDVQFKSNSTNDEKLREAKEKLKDAEAKLFASLSKLREEVKEPSLSDYESDFTPAECIKMRQWAYEQARWQIREIHELIKDAEEVELENEDEYEEIELDPFEIANCIYEWIITGNIPE